MPVSPELSGKLAKFSPTSFSSKQLRELEALLEEYPDEAMVLFSLLVTYEQSGDEVKREDTLRKLVRLAKKRVYIALTILQIMRDNEFLAAFRKEWPQRELTDHPARGGHPFTPMDFILFEELSIRHALLKEQTEAAINHFVRLTEFGTSGQVLDSLANKISKTLLFAQLDRTPVLPEKLPSALLKVKHPAALKLLTDSYWGHVEVLRTKMDINTRANKPTSGVRSGPRIGRNTPCTCGSGKKYKRCCGR